MLPRGMHIMPYPMQDSDDNDDDDPQSESNQEIANKHEIAETHEADEQVAVERRRQLYPSAAVAGLPLPTGWSTNIEDKSKNLIVSHHSLRITHKDRESAPKNPVNSGNASAVRANAPIPQCCGIYYFEITILRSPTGCLGIGLCQKGVQTNRLPGWDQHSYGYHGDDGNFFSSSGNGTQYGEKFSTGDVVGCGVNLIDNYIFFTKNGAFQGTAMRQIELQDHLYPVVGLQHGLDMLDVNFGQVKFMYDIYKDMEKARAQVTRQIYEIDLPVVDKHEWCKKIIGSWLQSEGYSDTLEVFNRVTNKATDEPIELIRNRKRITDLILAGRSGDALKAILEVYPGMVGSENMVRTILMLKAQNFVEMAFQFANLVDTPRPKAANGLAAMGNGTSHPSTSSLLSNPYKRTRSYVSSSASCTDSDGPPTRKLQPGRVETNDELNSDQPCSSRNGCSNAGNGVARHDMDTRVQEETDEVSTISDGAENHHGVDFTADESSRAAELVQMGREISGLARRLNLSTEPECAKMIETALGALVLTKNAFRSHELLKKVHVRKLAAHVNRTIMENYYLETNRLQPVLTLERVLEWWQLRKHKLTISDCATADYVNDKRIVYGIVSSDDESSIDSDGEEEDESDDDSDLTDSSDFTDSDGESSGAEDASSVSEMDDDMPENSRATISCA